MIQILLVVTILLLLVVIVLLALLLRRKVAVDLSPLEKSFQAVEKTHERTERSVREEIAKNREEAGTLSRQSREELANSLKGFGDILHRQLTALTQSNEQRLEKMRATVEQRLQLIQEDNGKKLEQFRLDAAATAKALREEVSGTLKGFNESLVASFGEIGNLQKGQLDVFSQRLETLTQSNDQKLGTMRETVEKRLELLQADNGKRLDQMREEAAGCSQKTRDEVNTSLKAFTDSLVKTVAELGSSQRTQFGNVVEQLMRLTESNEKRLDLQRTAVDERLKQIQGETATKLDQMREDTGRNAKQMREEVGASLKAFNDSVIKGMTGMAESQRLQMESFSAQLGSLNEANQQKLDALKAAVEDRLKNIQEDNNKNLEQMRATVDEKLQGTLERRLGEAFTQVSERLDQVHKGLGEMQSLATGVGDLKKMMTNVKSRGAWGEVQLGAMLEQCLTPEQYATNVSTKDGGERVEFAIKFPGRGEDKDEVVWLPIDAKFPTEDYQRLVEAQETADLEGAAAAAKQLENRIKASAWDISEKYLNPPKTTDFGILFLPNEGLFAEVVRRTGLTEFVQRECKVMIAGPTTLWSILNSLQMGFRTLAVQERSSDVWNLLAAVKNEWGKYGDILGKVQKKLQEASNTIDDAAKRTRAIGRKLRDVQALPSAEAKAVLMLPESDTNGEADLDLVSSN